MRLLADENISRHTVEALRALGHDVEWVVESSPSIQDVEILQRADETHRIVLTFDSDFGTLTFKHRKTATAGIIYLKLPVMPPEERTQIIVNKLRNSDSWEGKYSVVELHRVRMVPLLWLHK